MGRREREVPSLRDAEPRWSPPFLRWSTVCWAASCSYHPLTMRPPVVGKRPCIPTQTAPAPVSVCSSLLWILTSDTPTQTMDPIGGSGLDGQSVGGHGHLPQALQHALPHALPHIPYAMVSPSISNAGASLSAGSPSPSHQPPPKAASDPGSSLAYYHSIHRSESIRPQAVSRTLFTSPPVHGAPPHVSSLPQKSWDPTTAATTAAPEATAASAAAAAAALTTASAATAPTAVKLAPTASRTAGDGVLTTAAAELSADEDRFVWPPSCYKVTKERQTKRAFVRWVPTPDERLFVTR